jgi:hypothetical protein
MGITRVLKVRMPSWVGYRCSIRGQLTMRYPIAFLFACLLFVFNIGAQSPSHGHVQGDAYVNSYFHVSYRWAKILQPYDTSSPRLPQKPPSDNYEFLLFSARQGDQPYGVILLAIKLNAQTPHSMGIKDAADLMERIMRFRPEQHVTILSKKHLTKASGFTFDEVDYTENGGYSAAIITPVKNFLLVFKCNAQSATDLVEMATSVADLQTVK